MVYHQESETIASSDSGPSVVPAISDFQQIKESDKENENEYPRWDGYDSEDETEVFNDKAAQVV